MHSHSENILVDLVCVFSRDTYSDQANTWSALRDLDLDSVASADDVAVLRYLCAALSIRAAQIVAASMSIDLLSDINT